MSQLNQIVASLLRDINLAKSQADYETRELARNYAADDILKYFTVPRIGIQNLDVEIKYAVETVVEQPFQTGQAQDRLSSLLKGFAVDTAKLLQADVAKLVNTNSLYKRLAGSYPGNEWQKNIADAISDELIPASANPANIAGAISQAEKKLSGQLPSLLPVAKKLSVFSIIPNAKGAYQVISFDDNGEVDMEIAEMYDDESAAVADSKTLITALKANQLAPRNFIRNEEKKVEIASILVGNRQLTVQIPAAQPVVNKDVFFREKLGVKTKIINNPIRRQPWVVGRINPTGINRNETITEETDDSLRKAAMETLRQRFLQLQASVSKLVAETKTTSLNVLIEAEKLKAVKPENLLTLRFTLNAQDFNVFDNDQQTTVI